jgi:hypothetical protein
MGDATNFLQKARDAEALGALTENPLMRITLWALAQDYWALAEQEQHSSRSDTVTSSTKQLQDQPQLGPPSQRNPILR